MELSFHFLVIALVAILVAVCAGDPTVDTRLGKIVGVQKKKSVFGQEMLLDLFFGIPYAEPPVGKLRFQKPEPKQALTSDGTPFMATKHGNICYQMNMFPMTGLTHSEDCLYLNIYAPSGRTDPLPVMLFIHGGGMSGGASDQYVSDTLALYGDVMVVTINYRVTMWGFLSTGDKYAPGNIGLWDQHLAIKWVHDHIDAFGGDTNRITIFGQSAGAFSVGLQTLYHGNEGLFQRAISLSGSLWDPVDHDPKPDAQKLGRLVGCEQTDSQELVKCLQSLPAVLLHDTLNNFTNGLLASIPFPFLPYTDGFMFDRLPKDLLLSDNKGRSVFSGIDFMSGICAEEGILMLSPLTGVNDPESFAPNRTSFKDFVPGALAQVRNFPPEDVPEVIKEIVAHEYIDWSDPDNVEKLRTKAVQIISDAMFTAPMQLALNQHSKLARESKRTYMYKFDIILPRTMLPTPSWFNNATHGDELMYLFFDEDNQFFNDLPGHEGQEIEDWERDVAKYVMDLFTNFAKTGNPNEPRPIPQKWPTYTTEDKPYFRIQRDPTAAAIGNNFLPSEENLWNNIVPKLFTGVGKAKTRQEESGYCEKDGGCEP